MGQIKCEIRTNSRGEEYEFYTAKPKLFRFDGVYMIILHNNIVAKSRSWDECIALYNRYIGDNYISRDTTLQKYTADFLDLNTPTPQERILEVFYGYKTPVKRCRECDRWFHRNDMSRDRRTCFMCHSGDSETDKNKAGYIQVDGAPPIWKIINQHTHKKLTKCRHCEEPMANPKYLSSKGKPLRYSKFCASCWKSIVKLLENAIKW